MTVLPDDEERVVLQRCVTHLTAALDSLTETELELEELEKRVPGLDEAWQIRSATTRVAAVRRETALRIVELSTPFVEDAT